VARRRARTVADSLSQRCLALYYARWRAGTLFTLSPEEHAFVAVLGMPALASIQYFLCVDSAVNAWPLLRTPAEDEARMHGVYGALQVALELDARDELSEDDVAAVHDIMAGLHNDSLADGTLLLRLHAACGLSVADWMALRAIAMRSQPDEAGDAAKCAYMKERSAASAAADVARYGLRRCALPSCGATEAHPKLFKLCGRCRGAAYCGAAHSKEDWKRHKRVDGCTPAGQQAA
jgi:hypothetical protein